MIAIIDYGQGNLRSVEAACRAVGAESVVTNDPEEIWRSNALILPGVGSFGTAMKSLGYLVEHIKAFAESRPVLGICLGMQLLMDGSDENGGAEGLGIIRGDVQRLPDTERPIPHVGWLPVGERTPFRTPAWTGTPLEGTSSETPFYFCHSYNVRTADQHWLASAPFGTSNYCAAVRSGNVIGVQFHPEKSGPAGLNVFRTFRRIVEMREAA